MHVTNILMSVASGWKFLLHGHSVAPMRSGSEYEHNARACLKLAAMISDDGGIRETTGSRIPRYLSNKFNAPLVAGASVPLRRYCLVMPSTGATKSVHNR